MHLLGLGLFVMVGRVRKQIMDSRLGQVGSNLSISSIDSKLDVFVLPKKCMVVEFGINYNLFVMLSSNMIGMSSLSNPMSSLLAPSFSTRFLIEFFSSCSTYSTNYIYVLLGPICLFINQWEGPAHILSSLS